MNRRRAAWLAWALCALVVGLSVVGLALTFAAPNAPRLAPKIVQITLESIIPVVCGGVAALIVAHQPRNMIGWLLMVIALGSVVAGVIQISLLQSMTAAQAATPAILFAAWLSNWSWWMLIGPLLLILVLFPTGRPPGPRWRWVIVAVAALFATFVFLQTFAEFFQLLDTDIRLRNPIGFIPGSVLIPFFSWPWLVMLVTTAMFCVASVVVRYRRAAAQERAQIKWFLYACAVFFMLIFPFGAFASDNVLLNALFSIVFNLAILTIPASIGIAILRYRLYDIDVIIRRTLIYGALTALLAAVYFGSVITLQALLRPLVGVDSELALVASTLAIAALFQPLRRRIQHVIDRRFYRRKYDAQQTLQAFSMKMRDETDLDELTADLVQVVDDTLQPSHVSLWLR
jgi:MFS family permease